MYCLIFNHACKTFCPTYVLLYYRVPYTHDATAFKVLT